MEYSRMPLHSGRFDHGQNQGTVWNIKEIRSTGSQQTLKDITCDILPPSSLGQRSTEDSDTKNTPINR